MRHPLYDSFLESHGPRSRSEERLDAYLRATTEAVYVMSPDWSEMRRLSGSGFLADTPGPNSVWTEPYIPEEARPRVLQAVQHAVETGSMFQLEHPVRQKDGTIAWTLSKAVPIRNATGEITEWVGTATDITALRQNNELRRALEERDALLKEVHHRVKNNLQVITSLLEMQSHQTENVNTKTLFEDACNRVGSIAVIHEMIYQSGSFSAVDLCAYAKRLVPFLMAFYEAQSRIELQIQGSKVQLELQKAVPCGLLLNELVSNAFKHAFIHGRTGKLDVLLTKGDNDVCIVVEDTGVGLREGFDLYNSPTLGLQLVRMLVEQLRGTVNFRFGPGCRVEVHIPMEASAETNF